MRVLDSDASALSPKAEFRVQLGLSDPPFAKGPNLVQKEPKNIQIIREWANHFFRIYQHLQSHMNLYLATY